MALADWFREGGAFMFAVLAALFLVGLGDGIALLFSLLAQFTPPLRPLARAFSVVMLVASTIPVLIGIAGWSIGMDQVEAALALVDPAMRDQILAQGSAEARLPMVFGGGSSAVLFLGAAVAAALAYATPRTQT